MGTPLSPSFGEYSRTCIIPEREDDWIGIAVALEFRRDIREMVVGERKQENQLLQLLFPLGISRATSVFGRILVETKEVIGLSKVHTFNHSGQRNF